ncbi:alpha/beta fold hydrolase [Virgibacillus byunsanensis]|uniref:Alpha/beta fold hydrolase n=1 Tax=Virgibacillus byunsanensis TaxID=570945 RepID=A0ABW3LNR0_9BACI
MFANINKTRIFFDINGAGFVPDGEKLKEKPVCFVLHGGPGGTHAYFKPYLDDLTEEIQLVYIDNRGSGFSATGPQSSYNLENNVEDIEELRKYLGLGKIWVLGHSYGGTVAMNYALKYQDNLEGLILATTTASYRFMDKAKKFVEKNGTDEQKRVADILFNGAFESQEQLTYYFEVMEPLYSRDHASANNDQPKLKINRSYEAINEGFGGFLKELDITGRLSTITVPSLVIAGRHDWITPIEESEIIASELPNSKFLLLEESSHSVMKDETNKLNSTILGFVKKTRS